MVEDGGVVERGRKDEKEVAPSDQERRWQLRRVGCVGLALARRNA